mgnify:CR=1 FL=1
MKTVARISLVALLLAGFAAPASAVHPILGYLRMHTGTDHRPREAGQLTDIHGQGIQRLVPPLLARSGMHPLKVLVIKSLALEVFTPAT